MRKKSATEKVGRPSLDPIHKRKPWVLLRVTDEEREGIRQKAAQHRQPIAVYVRRIAYRGYTRNTGAIRATIVAIVRIDEILSSLDSPDAKQIAEEIRAELNNIRKNLVSL